MIEQDLMCCRSIDLQQYPYIDTSKFSAVERVFASPASLRSVVAVPVRSPTALSVGRWVEGVDAVAKRMTNQQSILVPVKSPGHRHWPSGPNPQTGKAPCPSLAPVLETPALAKATVNSGFPKKDLRRRENVERDCVFTAHRRVGPGASGMGAAAVHSVSPRAAR